MYPLTLFSAVDNTGIAQDLHVMRKRGLRNMQIIQQHTGTFFTAAKKFQYPQTVFVTKCLKHFCIFNIFRCHAFHLTFKIIDMSLL